MLKGVYKEIVSVKIDDNRLYESAFFILKKDVSGDKNKSTDDLMFEANRILCENGVKSVRKKKKLYKKILFSALCVIIGAVLGFLGGLFSYYFFL